MRLDHLITKRTELSERAAKLAIASGEVQVAGVVEKDLLRVIDKFTQVTWDGQQVQAQQERVYLMLNKPRGYLSATRDDQHPVALDLIDHPAKADLHIAGRLDRSSTGLLLLTNDSEWSESLSHPDAKVEKTYLIETIQPIPNDAVQKFAAGFYFATEDITTRPAELQIISPRKARVTISEGKYHQIKRMFHRLEPQVQLSSLHRERIGHYTMPTELAAGDWMKVPQGYDEKRPGY